MTNDLVVGIQIQTNINEQQTKQEMKKVSKIVNDELELDKMVLEVDRKELKKDLEQAIKNISEFRKKGQKDLELTATLEYNQFKKQLRDLDGEIDKLGDKMSGKSGGFGDFFKSAFKFTAIVEGIKAIGAGIKNLFSDMINLSKEYESAFAGVRKTVNGTEGDFKRLDSSLRKMSQTIPMTYQDLSKIMELGGQLGVDIENLDKFTETIAKLGTATNLTTEEAATMLAQFANIMNMDLNDMDKLGSTIVDLGNNFATTEKDITNFASRIAGAGAILGMNEASLMGIATAFSSVGIEAEAGGTAVQKVMLDLNSAATIGGEQLEKYSEVLGLTAEEFKNLMNDDPTEVFIDFVDALSNAGKNAGTILDDLGMKDTRLNRAFLSMAQNSDLLKEAIERGNVAWEENIALTNEAEQRYGTLESQIIMLQNERANALEKIGEKVSNLSIYREKVLNTGTDLLAWVTGTETEFTELSDVLNGQLKEVQESLEQLEYQLQEGQIGWDEYKEKKNELNEQYRELDGLIQTEIEGYKTLKDQVENLTDGMSDLVEKQRESVANFHEEGGKLKEYEAELKEMTESTKYSSDEIAEQTEKVNEQREAVIEAYNEYLRAEQAIRDNTEAIKTSKEELEKYNTVSSINADAENLKTEIIKEQTTAEDELEQRKLRKEVLLEREKALQEQLAIAIDETKKAELQMKLDNTRNEIDKTQKNIDAISDKLVNLKNLFDNIGGKITATDDLDAKKKEVALLKEKFNLLKEEAKQKIKNNNISTGGTNTNTSTGSSGGGGGGGSKTKSDPVAKAKEQAKQIRDEKIKALEQEELDELEKNKRLDEIYTEYKNKILEIDGKTNDDMLKNAEDFLKDYRKNKQDEIEAEKKSGEDSIKNIEKYGKEIEKLGEKREDYKNEAVKNLREVNKELEDLDKENTQNLADRYLEVEKAIREIEKENSGIKYDSSSIEQLQEYQRQGMDNYGGVDIDKLIEYKKLQTEINLLKENTTEETIKEAQERKNLTETEKQLLEYEEKKTQLLEKQAILQATANQGDLGSENKALIEEDGMIKYYDAEKEAYTEITDYKNQELARQLLEKQTEMESEYQLNVEQKEKEEALLQEHYDKLESLYQSDTEIYKGELKKKEKAVRDYVEKVKAMLSEIPASHRAYGGNLLNGQVSIVGENGPEAIIARQSSYVQPRNAVQNSSTVYNNQSSLSINGLEFGSFNNIDEMLIALKDKLTYRS